MNSVTSACLLSLGLLCLPSITHGQTNAADSSAAATPSPAPAAPPAGRILQVDQHGTGPYTTLAAAAKDAQPGDTINIAKGSGPYHEELFVRTSGLPGAPITIEGNGELITGFEPITAFTKEGDSWVCDFAPILKTFKHIQQFHLEGDRWVNDNVKPKGIPPFPSVLTYKGERLLQDPATGQFTKYATLSPDGLKMTLLPGVGTEGWELASRPFAIRLYDTAYQTYRNIRASGSLNDGVNGHGTGHDLLFENIECFQNIDEGFSIHDHMDCEIRGGNCWGNDNGINNAASSHLKMVNVDLHDNLGWGFGMLHGATSEIENVRIWKNGMTQFIVNSAGSAQCKNVLVYTPTWTTRQWVSTQESRGQPKVEIVTIAPTGTVTGDQPQVMPTEQPEDLTPPGAPTAAK